MTRETNGTVQLQLTALSVDPSLQPRIGGLDPDHVRVLQDAPDSWPPLVVVRRGGKYILVDGFHRLAAAQNLGMTTVSVQVMDVPADGDLRALAFALNAVHGRPLSLDDRRHFAQHLLQRHPDWADREIGRRCGLSSNTVGKIREIMERAAQIEQSEIRLGAGGYVYSVGSNPKQRPPGQLPDVGLIESASEAVSRLFTPAERIQQRQIAYYLRRLAVALEDQNRLKGWENAEDAAEACRLVLGQEHAKQLADRLGYTSRNVLDVAIALGYDDTESIE